MWKRLAKVKERRYKLSWLFQVRPKGNKKFPGLKIHKKSHFRLALASLRLCPATKTFRAFYSCQKVYVVHSHLSLLYIAHYSLELYLVIYTLNVLKLTDYTHWTIEEELRAKNTQLPLPVMSYTLAFYFSVCFVSTLFLSNPFSLYTLYRLLH